MPLICSLAFAVWQDTGLAAHDLHLMRWFAGIIAVALVVQAFGVLLAASYAAKFLMKIDKMSKAFEERSTPILEKTNELLTDLSPKVKSITSNVEQISFTVREKVDEVGVTVSQVNETVSNINVTVSEANSRTRRQVARVDGIVSEALIATEDISRTVQQGIRIPVREIAGIVAGVKAAIETLVARSPFSAAARGAAARSRQESDNPYDL